MKKQKGKIFIIPTPVSADLFNDSLTTLLIRVIQSLDLFIVEELKTARRFLRKAGYDRNFDEVTFFVLNEHSTADQLPGMLIPIEKGRNAGLLSEAGMPCIADPGSSLVALAHRQQIEVTPLPGPNSITLALAASGLNGQNFAFHGYLPVDKKARDNKIKELEKISNDTGQTQIFMEAPYRNLKLAEAITRVCHRTTLLCIASHITAEDEFIRTMPVSEWTGNLPSIHKKPTIFLIGKEQ